MYRRLAKAGVFCALALGLWMATPEAQAQRRGWSGGWGRGGWSSPGMSFGVGPGGFYAGPSYGGYGYGGYGWNGYGSYGYGSRFWNPGWYSSYSSPRYSYYSSPGYSTYSYPSTTYYYSTPAATYSAPSTTYYDSAPATTYYESSPSTTYSAAPATASNSRDTAHIRVHVPEASAQIWVNDAPTQQRGMDRLFETPPLRDNRTNTYEIRAKWQDNGRTMEQTRTVRLHPGEQEVISFGRTE